MQSYGGNMSGAEKIAISAAIGGTAEALGGGKFANSGVTREYVMALNHMMHQGEGEEGKLPKLPNRVMKPDDFLAKKISKDFEEIGEVRKSLR